MPLPQWGQQTASISEDDSPSLDQEHNWVMLGSPGRPGFLRWSRRPPAGREGALRRKPDVKCSHLPSCLESLIAKESRPLLPVKDRPLLLTSTLTSEEAEAEAATWRPLLLPPCFFKFLFFFFFPISSLSSSSSFLPLFFFQSGRGIQGDTLILLRRTPDRKWRWKTMV